MAVSLALRLAGLPTTNKMRLGFTVGVWVGVKLARRIQPGLFYRLVYLGMFLTGSKLVWDALH